VFDGTLERVQSFEAFRSTLIEPHSSRAQLSFKACMSHTATSAAISCILSLFSCSSVAGGGGGGGSGGSGGSSCPRITTSQFQYKTRNIAARKNTAIASTFKVIEELNGESITLAYRYWGGSESVEA
jgi:hypothetical protein